MVGVFIDSYFTEVEMNVLNLPVVTQKGGVAEPSILAPELVGLLGRFSG